MALDIAQNIYDNEHTFQAIIYNSYGGIYEQMDEYDNAIDYYYKSLDTVKNTLGESRPYYADLISKITR